MLSTSQNSNLCFLSVFQQKQERLLGKDAGTCVSPVNGAQILTGFTGAPLFAFSLLCHCSEAIVTSVCLARRKGLEICLKPPMLEAALGG